MSRTDAPRRSMAAISARGERLWRIRKGSRTMESWLRPASEGAAELEYVCDGRSVYRSRWPSRESAAADAAIKLGQLQIRGWSTHW